MLSSYHRWIFEKQKCESVESLREWVLQEAEFQTKALEAVLMKVVMVTRGVKRSKGSTEGPFK